MQVAVHVKDRTLFIVDDNFSYALAEERPVKNRDTGEMEDRLVQFKWFKDLGQVFQALINMKVRAADCKTLKQLKQTIVQAKEELKAEWSTHET